MGRHLPSTAPAARPEGRESKSRLSVSLVLGELMLTMGVIVLLFAFYEAQCGHVLDQCVSFIDT